MRNTFYLGLLILLAAFAFILPEAAKADTDSVPTPTPTPSPTPVATVESVEGKPITFRFKDGREATLKSASLESAPIKSVFQVADNNCSNRQNMKCTYNFMPRFFHLVMIWTKNPDSSRIGRPVSRVTEFMGPNGTIRQTETLQALASLTGGILSKKYPTLSLGLPSHEIECEDFSWLPEGNREAPATLHVSRWDGEENVPNPETGFAENRTIGGGNGVELLRTSPQTLRIESVNALTGLLKDFDIFNVSPTTSLTMKLNSGQICQTGLSSNLRAEVLAFFPKLIDQLQNKITPQDYIKGSDQLLEQRDVLSTYQRWVNELSTVIIYSSKLVYE